MFVDVFLEHFGELFGESSGSEIFEVHVPINGVVLEILVLFSQSYSHLNLIIDILLRSILDSHVAQLQRHLSIQNHPWCVSSPVHNIYLGDNSKSPASIEIPLSGKVKTLRGSHICVCRYNCQDNSPILPAVSFCHSGGDFLNVVDLVPHWDFGDTRQIDESQVGTFVGVDWIGLNVPVSFRGLSTIPLLVPATLSVSD